MLLKIALNHRLLNAIEQLGISKKNNKQYENFLKIKLNTKFLCIINHTGILQLSQTDRSVVNPENKNKTVYLLFFQLNSVVPVERPEILGDKEFSFCELTPISLFVFIPCANIVLALKCHPKLG